MARTRDEITISYVQAFLERASQTGVSLGAFLNDHLVGEIHATRLGSRQFDHVPGDLTIAVHPEVQGKGVGSVLFAAFFHAAALVEPKVSRIELIARSGNDGAL